jgi:AraC-like DNA-binding protein
MTSAYLMLIMRELGRTPATAAALLEGIAANASDIGTEITLGDQRRQVRNVNALAPAGWGLEIGDRFDASTHGPVGFAAVSAATLADAVGVIVRFAHVRSPYFRFEAHSDGDYMALLVDECLLIPDDERIPMVESLVLSVEKLIALVLGEPLGEAFFDFAWPPPPYAARYGDYSHGTVRFGARRTGITFPQRWMRLKCPMADPVVYGESVRKLDALHRRIEGDEYVVARVEQEIETSSASVPSLEQVAATLHVSGRTLIRGLRRAGTTYHDLIDTYRRQRAEELLSSCDFRIAEVSHRVGYEDPTNFGRACRRWFGMSPGRYRKTLMAARNAVRES